MFRDALETAYWYVGPSADDGNYLASVLGDISEAQAEAGLWQEAVETARAIDRPSSSADALQAVVEKQAVAGLPNDALGTARTIDTGLQRALALAEVGRAQAEAGDDPGPVIGEALDSARAYAATSVEDPHMIEFGLRRFADALARCGFVAEALEIARSFKTPYVRASTLGGILEYEADDQLFEEGIAAAREVPQPVDRAVAFQTLARCAPSAERAFAGALEAVRTIGDPAQRGRGETNRARAGDSWATTRRPGHCELDRFPTDAQQNS